MERFQCYPDVWHVCFLRFQLNCPDTTAPEITLIGNNSLTLALGTPYVESGATAEDDVDGDITANIIVGGDMVDENTPGTYLITYNVMDSAMNAAEEVVRTVIVSDGGEGIWLEAECAVVGSGWDVVPDVSASGGEYVVFNSGNNFGVPSTDTGANIAFNFMADAGLYSVYGLVSATNGTDDSFWVRANGGNWIKWNSIPRSTDFSWQQVWDNDNGNTLVSFNLVEGNNVIEFANREDGTPLDKIYVAPVGSDVPLGLGGVSVNCDDDGLNRAPVALAVSDVSQGIAPLTVVFDGSGSTDDAGITSYSWNFGDGSTGNGATVSRTYLDLGVYTATLTVSDGEFTSTDTVVITVTSPQGGEGIWLEAECAVVGSGWDVVPDASASGGEYVVFNSGNNFGIPSTDTGANIAFNFMADAGLYSVYGLVSATNGTDDSFWVRANGGDWIKWNSIPRSTDFSWQQVWDNDNGNTLVSFNLVEGNNVIEFANREDGTPLDKIYVAPVGSDVPLGLGGVSVNCDDDGLNRAPVALAVSDVSQGIAPLTVVFDGSGSTDDAGITSYSWNFGDGSTGNGATVSHTYLDLGVYTATLTVSDGEFTSTDTVVITVTSPQGGEGIWLEAECAVVGSGWDVVPDASASGGEYVVFNSGNNFGIPSTDTGANIVFNFMADAGLYSVYGLVSATNGTDDSFWVRANGGDWIKWNSIPRSTDFSWQQVWDNDNGNALVSFNLVEGNNVIEFANREDGTPLDKIYVAPVGSDAPLGLGGVSINCDTDSTVENIMLNKMYMYPNPATDTSSISFEKKENVEEIIIFDMSGRMVQRFDAEEIKRGDHYQIDVYWIPAGTYIVRSRNAEGIEFSKQMVIKR